MNSNIEATLKKVQDILAYIFGWLKDLFGTFEDDAE